MRRHGLVALGLVALAWTASGVLVPTATHADSPYYITNIGAQAGGGSIVYNVCVFAPSTNPPEAGGVTIVDSTGQQRGPAGLVFSGTFCGSNLFLMQAQFAGLPGGMVTFQSACVLLAPTLDGQGTPVAVGPGVPCLTRGSGLVSNFSGDTVEKDCKVDVDPSGPTRLFSCNGPGVRGIFGEGPDPTSTPTQTPTNTATPLPTNTATPTPTNTAVSTATSPGQTGGGSGGGGGTGAGGSGGVPPTTPSGAGSSPSSSATPRPTSTSGSQIIVIQSSGSGASSPRDSGTTVPQSSGTATSQSGKGTATSGTGSVSVSNPGPGSQGGSSAPSSPARRPNCPLRPRWSRRARAW